MKQIQLTQGYCAIVDDEDFDFLSQFKWHAMVQKRRDGTCRVYAMRRVTKDKKSIPVLMHGQIMGHVSGKVLDHIDGNSLNNQRCNLRFVTTSQNNTNRDRETLKNGVAVASVYRGVTPSGNLVRPWKAQIWIAGKMMHLGHYTTEEEAAKAFDKCAVAMRGEFARTNF